MELGTERIRKLLVQYAVPAIIAMTASSLYNMVDRKPPLLTGRWIYQRAQGLDRQGQFHAAVSHTDGRKDGGG